MLAFLKNRTDQIGMISSGLCIFHCAVTPFLILFQVYLTNAGFNYGIWGAINFLFLVISFWAMIVSVKKSTVTWLKVSFVIAWIALALLVINEFFEGFHLPFDLTYFPAFALIALHIINRRHS